MMCGSHRFRGFHMNRTSTRPPSPVIRPFARACILAIAASPLACTPSVSGDVKVAPGFSSSGHTVSVFGVYKDGQMSSEAWDALRPRLEPLLGGRECEIARGSSPQAVSPLSAAIDDYARTNGPSDDLLAQLAPAARGDLILVLIEAGTVSPDEKVSVVDAPSPGKPGPAASHAATGLATFAPDKHAAARDVLQLSASLFSVSQGRSVASVDMQYSGDSIDKAIGEFTDRMRRLLPASTCTGWNWDANVDPERIRKLED
jgi:hypothetical protein